MLSQILRDKAHEIHYVFRFARKALAKFRILSRHTCRAGIQIADTHHDTAHGHKGSCRKSKLLRAKHCCDRHVTTTHQLTIRLHTHLFPQTIHDQCLVCLGQSELPRKTRIVDGASRCRAGSSVIA